MLVAAFVVLLMVIGIGFYQAWLTKSWMIALITCLFGATVYLMAVYFFESRSIEFKSVERMPMLFYIGAYSLVVVGVVVRYLFDKTTSVQPKKQKRLKHAALIWAIILVPIFYTLPFFAFIDKIYYLLSGEEQSLRFLALLFSFSFEFGFLSKKKFFA